VALRHALVALLAFILGACAAVPPGDAEGTAPPPSPVATADDRGEPDLEPVVAPPVDLWERIRRQLRFHTQYNSAIANARDHYLAQPRYLELISPRAERYLYFLVEEVERRELPIELALLPLVESALNPFAVSPQRAAGLWQIMPATADYLGMRRDWWFDARLDLRDATRFALDYLEALHGEFDEDWLLALAAYNAGKGRVRKAVRRNLERGRPTDYWSLELPRETRAYVPRLIALSTLIAFDEALGIDLPELPNAPAFVEVPTGGQVEMLRVAQIADLELSELRRYNPGQLRWATAPGSAHSLLLPVDRAERVAAALARLAPEDRVTWEHYRIRQGDSLIRIAQRFDTEVGLLREVNNLRGSFIRAGDTLMIPDSRAWRESLAGGGSRGVKRGYRVQRGDSLYEIARRFDISIDDIVTWNNLDPRSYLQPGQALTLYLEGG